MATETKFRADTFTYPALQHDREMAEAPRAHALSFRERIERQVIWDLCAHLAKAGYVPCLLDDGEDRTPVSTPKAAMELIFNLDDATLYFRSDGSKASVPAKTRECIRIILGNDGWDCVADMSAGRPTWDAAIQSFDFDQYDTRS